MVSGHYCGHLLQDVGGAVWTPGHLWLLQEHVPAATPCPVWG